MKETYRELGMYDTKTKSLIWRIAVGSLTQERTTQYAIEGIPTRWLVWVKYTPIGEQGLRVSLTRVLGGDLVDEDYNLSRTTKPSRYKLTTRGAEYLRIFGKYFNPGDTVTPALLRLKLNTPSEIWEFDHTLWCAERAIAIRSEVK